MGEARFATVLLLIFGSLSLLCATAGIYGVLFYAMGQRFKELALRIALGASRHTVALDMLRQGLAPVAVGSAAGLGAALSGNRILSSQLYGVNPTDHLSLGGASLLVIIAATLACYIPAARRAAAQGTAGIR